MKLPSGKLNVKIIAIDLDDTLLNKELQISERTINAIQQAVNKGIYIVLCSGRAENGILPYVRALNIAGRQHGRYLIGINGASVLDLHTRLPIYSQKLDGEILKFVYEEAKKRGLPAQVYDPSTIYASEDNAWTQIDAQMCKLNLKIEGNFPQFLDKGHPKMIIPAEPADVANFLPFLKENLQGKAECFISKPYFLEVMPYGVGKGSTIHWLADYLGIPHEQILCFGDSMNDESMIRSCNHSVAMCNGLEYIKDIAKYVTEKSNNDDGIADFLEKFVL